MKKKKPLVNEYPDPLRSKPEIIQNPFDAQREVSFFLRIHGHLPDKICGEVFAPCEYREDGVPINQANDYVHKLRESMEYRIKQHSGYKPEDL